MKKSGPFLITLFSLVLSATGLGAREVEREDFMNNFPLSLSRSGTNIGGGNSGSEYYANWCQGQSSLLRNVRDRARLKLNAKGDYNLANKILTDGLIQALKNSENQKDSILYRSLTRGLTIANYLSAATADNSEEKARGTNYVLNNYYDFVLEVVARRLELGGRIPYLHSTAETMDENLARFEENFVVYASAQLQWILSTLINEVRIGHKMQPTPIGQTKSVIKVILVLAAGVATDLEQSLWNYRFSCPISDLKALNESLGAYDQGNMEMFEDEKEALTYVVGELKRISRNLSENTGCL